MKHGKMSVHAIMFALLVILVTLVRCAPAGESSPGTTMPAHNTPTATLFLTPSPEPTSSAAPTVDLTPTTERVTAVPHNGENTADIEPLIFIPEQPSINTIPISQPFIVQSPGLDWRLVEYDANRLTLLSSNQASAQGDINGWRFVSDVPGQTIIVLEQETPLCERDPCPPVALNQQSITINVTD